MGVDGSKWAEEFLRTFGRRKVDIDQQLLTRWFQGAIDAGLAAGKPVAEAAAD